MPKKEPDSVFLKNRYKWLAKNAKSDALKLRACDRLAVLFKLLVIPLVDQEDQTNPRPEDIKVAVPDLDKAAAEMLKKFGGENATGIHVPDGQS